MRQFDEDEMLDLMVDEAIAGRDCGLSTPEIQQRSAQCRALIAQAGNARGAVPQIRVNYCRGWLAEQALCRRLRARGHQITAQRRVGHGRGSGVLDVLPAFAGARGITNTLESKHLDLDRYRVQPGQAGSPLDLNRLQQVMQGHLQQVQRHEALARRAGGLPRRESLVYQLEGARAGELETVRTLFRALARPQGVRGGVLRMD